MLSVITKGIIKYLYFVQSRLVMGDEVKLGGNINLSGFGVVSKPELAVLKKIIGSYARKFSDNLDGYESLSLNLKEIHKTEASEKYEIQGKLVVKGKVSNSDITDRNIFVATDTVLKKIESIVM